LNWVWVQSGRLDDRYSGIDDINSDRTMSTVEIFFKASEVPVGETLGMVLEGVAAAGLLSNQLHATSQIEFVHTHSSSDTHGCRMHKSA